MTIHIESQKGIPLYFQIMEEIKHLIASGQLAPGDKLPTVRQLAVDLAINPNTVAKAYDELRRENILDVRQGIGTFVKQDIPELGEETRRKKLRALCEAFVLEAQQYGFKLEEIRECLAALNDSK
jgi:GntR family transcriptional regulator